MVWLIRLYILSDMERHLEMQRKDILENVRMKNYKKKEKVRLGNYLVAYRN